MRGPATRRDAGGAIVALAALAVHARTAGFGLVDLDDRDLLVEDHAFLVGPGALGRVFGRAYLGVVDAGHAYYRPVVAASYVVDARRAGAGFGAYHLTNVVVWCAAAALLYAVLGTLGLGRAVSLAAALVFAVHPALASAVAWIPGRNDGLLAVFALASWLAFANGWRAAHFGLFAAAAFTKETALLLPLVFVAHRVTVVGVRPASAAWPVGYLVGWAAIGAARLAMHPLGAAASGPGVFATLSLFVGALGTIALPIDPTAIADLRDVALWPGVVAAVALGVATFVVPGVRRGVVALGATVFVATLLPVAVLGGSLVLDCRLVLPACGVLVAAGEIARAAAIAPRSLAAGVAAVLAGLGAITLASEGAYRDARAFALAAVAGSPRCALAHVSLGRSYQGAGEDDGALAQYQAALAFGPAEVVHNNVAVIWMKRGRWEDAERELASEIAINPRYGRAYANQAIVLRHEGRLAEACAAAGQARMLAPEASEASDEALRDEQEKDCAH